MKILFLILGIFSFILGVIALIVPLLPTTPFLIFALYCFTRSSKKFEEKFRNSKIYKKYLSCFFTKIKTSHKNFSNENLNMLDKKVIDIVKCTAPLLKERGIEITTKFYEILFENNPELKTLFNEKRQESGAQAKALAMSILTVSQNIDNLESILPTVRKISKVHVNAKVLPEQYPIIGKNLLIAFKKVLGNAINEETLDAWAKAYDVVSKIFIDVENDMRK